GVAGSRALGGEQLGGQRAPGARRGCARGPSCLAAPAPAPTSSSPQVLLSAGMPPPADGVRNVTSAQPMPPSRSASASGTASRGLPIVITGTRPILLSAARASAMVLLLDRAGCRHGHPYHAGPAVGWTAGLG